MSKRICTSLTLFIAIVARATAASGSPDIAYTKDGVLRLATAAGDVIRTVRTRVPIGRFTVSPDLARVVFVPGSGERYGGPLYLLDLGTNALRKLSRGFYWPPAPETADQEVYADPEFSPDGHSVAFAVRDVSRSGDTDAVEASGPLAVMELNTERVRLLQSTLDVSVGGPAFANQPHWSPDGTQVLVSFETAFAVVSADGKRLKMAEPPQLPADYDWSTALGWTGNQCILFGVGHNGVVRRIEILHLASMKFEEASQRFGFALGDQSGIETLQVSGPLLLVGRKTGSQLFDIKSHRLLGRFPASAKLLAAGRSADGGCE